MLVTVFPASLPLALGAFIHATLLSMSVPAHIRGSGSLQRGQDASGMELAWVWHGAGIEPAWSRHGAGREPA